MTMCSRLSWWYKWIGYLVLLLWESVCPKFIVSSLKFNNVNTFHMYITENSQQCERMWLQDQHASTHLSPCVLLLCWCFLLTLVRNSENEVPSAIIASSVEKLASLFAYSWWRELLRCWGRKGISQLEALVASLNLNSMYVYMLFSSADRHSGDPFNSLGEVVCYHTEF